MPITVDLGTRTIAAQGGVYGPGVVEVPTHDIKEQLEARMKELDEHEARQSGAVPTPEVPTPEVATTTSEPAVGATGTGEGEEEEEEEEEEETPPE